MRTLRLQNMRQEVRFSRDSGPELRYFGTKGFEWPTFPQLIVRGELVGYRPGVADNGELLEQT